MCVAILAVQPEGREERQGALHSGQTTWLSKSKLALCPAPTPTAWYNPRQVT